MHRSAARQGLPGRVATSQVDRTAGREPALAYMRGIAWSQRPPYLVISFSCRSRRLEEPRPCSPLQGASRRQTPPGYVTAA